MFRMTCFPFVLAVAGVPLEWRPTEEALGLEFKDAFKTGLTGPALKRIAHGEALYMSFTLT